MNITKSKLLSAILAFAILGLWVACKKSTDAGSGKDAKPDGSVSGEASSDESTWILMGSCTKNFRYTDPDGKDAGEYMCYENFVIPSGNGEDHDKIIIDWYRKQQKGLCDDKSNAKFLDNYKTVKFGWSSSRCDRKTKVRYACEFKFDNLVNYDIYYDHKVVKPLDFLKKSCVGQPYEIEQEI